MRPHVLHNPDIHAMRRERRIRFLKNTSLRDSLEAIREYGTIGTSPAQPANSHHILTTGM